MYQRLTEEVEKLWEVKATGMPVVVGALGAITLKVAPTDPRNNISSVTLTWQEKRTKHKYICILFFTN